MVCHSACLLLLLLTCLAGFSASETEQGETMGEISYGPASVAITGADIVTVGILYGFECSAYCYPACQYTWTRGNVTSQGPELSLQLLQWVPTQTLTCTVVNPASNQSVTVQKTLQVTAGPSNIQITGPPSLTSGAASIFTCSADCYPSCSYSWTVVLEGEVFDTAQGNTISVTPPASTVASETLICQAEDTVSHLYISTTLLVYVATVADISIAGESTVTMGQLSTFTCLVACIPTCSITWQYMGKSFQGDQVNIPILYQGNTTYIENKLHVTFSNYPTSKIEPLTCVATNTESLATITATMNLTVIDPMSVHPTSQALPVAGMSFSLQCDGPQNPASITWLKNNSPMPANERVHFSPENITMTFNPLLEEDDGLYQCVVGEGGPPIQSVGYNMQVNYGPNDVIIAGPESLEIGVTASFTCSAECSPSCSFSWTLYGKTVTGSVIDITVNRHVLKESISCQAENTLTGKTVVVNDSLSVSDPHWCGC